MDRSYPTYLRYLRLLISRAKTLSDRNRETEARELDVLKKRAGECLALLGERVESIHRRVVDLEFNRRYRGGRYGSGMIFDEAHAYETLDELLGLLKTALRIVQDTTTPIPARRVDTLPQVSSAPVPTPYSEADAKLYALIGEKVFETLTNPELWKRYRRVAEKELGRPISDHSFRGMVNRVRKHHRLPASKDIRRKLINNRRTN